MWWDMATVLSQNKDEINVITDPTKNAFKLCRGKLIQMLKFIKVTAKVSGNSILLQLMLFCLIFIAIE